MIDRRDIISKVADALIEAGSTFRQDKKQAYLCAINNESNENSKWVMQTILENSEVAEKNRSPLCDDTGIPHVVLEIGANSIISGDMIDAIEEGIRQGLRKLPGRPMGILGTDQQRVAQSGGLDNDPAGVEMAPILICRTEEDVTRLHVLMLGGGPEIRAKTYRVFHKHNGDVVLNEIADWAKEAVAQLGCTPCTLAVGIGRSHYEAASLMLQALVNGQYNVQNDWERKITDEVNKSDIGALGLHGNTTVLATFMKIGPQRASGVRIVCMRPCCCFEPRIATTDL